MKFLPELSEDIQCISETKEDGKKKYYIEGIFMQADIKNRNGRKYPLGILESEVNRYNKDYIQKNRAYGELGHPQGPTINLERVSHMITKLERDGSNFVGRAKVMTETPYGAIVKSLIDEGAQLGVSSRGMGSIKLVNGINEVQNDFYLATAGDVVSDPSGPQCFINGLVESTEWVFDERYGWRILEQLEDTKKELHKTYKSLTEGDKLKIFQNFLNEIAKTKNYK